MNLWDRFLNVLTAQPPFPMWLELLKLLVPVAAAVWVALRQLNISKATLEMTKASYELSKDQKAIAAAKLKLDLFDRRFKVYQEIYDGFTNAMFEELSGTHEPEESPFKTALNEAPFLFGKDIQDYIATIWKNWERLGEITGRRENNGGKVLPQDADEFKELTVWVNKESNHGINEKFNKYLNFEQWH